MLKSKWLNLVLDVDFMTLKILKLKFDFIFLEFISLYTSRHHHKKKIGYHQFNVLLLYYKQILNNCLFDITYLRTTYIIA